MDKLNLYYGTTIVRNTANGEPITNVNHIIIKTCSQSEAKLIAIDDTLKKFRITDGWYGHEVSLDEVDYNWLEEVVESHGNRIYSE